MGQRKRKSPSMFLKFDMNSCHERGRGRNDIKDPKLRFLEEDRTTKELEMEVFAGEGMGKLND